MNNENEENECEPEYPLLVPCAVINHYSASSFLLFVLVFGQRPKSRCKEGDVNPVVWDYGTGCNTAIIPEQLVIWINHQQC